MKNQLLHGGYIMKIRSGNARGRLSLMTLLTLLLTSFTACNNMRIYKDEIETGKPKGYVAFHSPVTTIQVYSFQDGREIDEDMKFFGFRPAGITRAPGKHEFIIYHTPQYGDVYKERFSVSVYPDAITYVSVAQQGLGKVTSVSEFNYRVNISVGSTPMPISPEPTDIKRLTSALSDKDWGTRRFALRGLREIKVIPDSMTLERIRFLTSRDRYKEVRRAAFELLESLDEEIPSSPLFFETFQDNYYHPWYKTYHPRHFDYLPWYIGTKDGESDYYFDGEGYNIDSRAEKWAWEIKDLLDLLSDIPNYNIEVDVSRKEGVSNLDYGFVLLQNRENYYHLSISKNGSGRVGLIDNSVLQDPLIPWQNHAKESIFSNNVSNLKLEVRGRDATYIVNGTVIGRFKLYDGFTPNMIGLFTYGKQKIVFKSIRIEER